MILTVSQATLPVAEKLIYTVRFGNGAGSGVPGSWLLHLIFHCGSFIPSRSVVFLTARDPPDKLFLPCYSPETK
jgi:hypothetical protein